MHFNNKNTRYFIFLSASFLLIISALGYFPYQIDDSYITYRYAANLLHGYGWVYNPGGPSVEGFTSPLWLLLLTGLASVFSVTALPAVVPWLGVLVAILSVAVIGGMFTGKRQGGELSFLNLQYFIAAALFVLLPSIPHYAASGLEADLFGLMVLIAAGIGANKFSAGMTWLLLAAVWIRPEALWIPIMLACQLVVLDGSWRVLLTQRFIRPVIMVATGAVVLLGFRWHVFSDVFPNTYYAKTPNYSDGLDYVWTTLRSGWAGGLVLLGLFGAVLGQREHRAFFVAGLSWIPAVILEGGDWMPVGRMLMPSLILFCLAASGIANAKYKVDEKLFYTGLAAALIVAGTLMYLRTQLEQKSEFSAQCSYVSDTRVMVAWLNTNNIHSVALLDIGEIGFKANVDIFDLAGLTDKTIAKSKGGFQSKQFDIAYLTDVRKPEVVIFRLPKPRKHNDKLAVTSYSEVERRLLSSKAFTRDYTPYLAVVPGYKRSPYYGQLIFLRKGFRIDDKFVHDYAPYPQLGLYKLTIPVSKCYADVMKNK